MKKENFKKLILFLTLLLQNREKEHIKRMVKENPFMKRTRLKWVKSAISPKNLNLREISNATRSMGIGNHIASSKKSDLR